jgi:hypothetical protein
MQEMNLNQKWINYALDHGMRAYPESGDRLGIVIEIPWWNPITKERGIFYHYCVSSAEVRAALGY